MPLLSFPLRVISGWGFIRIFVLISVSCCKEGSQLWNGYSRESLFLYSSVPNATLSINSHISSLPCFVSAEKGIRISSFSIPSCADGLYGLWHLAAFELVQLGGDDHRMVAIAHHPVVHHFVIGRGLVADIHQQKHQLKHGGFLQIPLDHLSPLGLGLQRNLCVAVSRQIYIVQRLIDVVKIDGLRLSRLGRGSGIGLAVHQGIDQEESAPH